MNQRYHRHHRRSKNGCGFHSTINRVVNGLSDALGVGRGLVIAGFVVGLFLAPLLSALVFFAALYWVSYPEQSRRHIDRLTRVVRNVTRKFNDSVSPSAATSPGYHESVVEDAVSPQHPRPDQPSADTLRERFADLDRRAKSIEEFVASEEYRLEREFKRIDD